MRITRCISRNNRPEETKSNFSLGKFVIYLLDIFLGQTNIFSRFLFIVEKDEREEMKDWRDAREQKF